MRKLKRAIFALVSLLAIGILLNGFTGDAQTRRKPAAEPEQNGPVAEKFRAPLPVRAGVDYSKFDHAQHSPNCETCHIANHTYPKSTVKQPYLAPYNYDERVTQYPEHPACEGCHSIPQFSLPSTRGFCLICHENDRRTVKSTFPDQRPDQFVIKFPHDVHTGNLNAQDFNVGLIDVGNERDEAQAKNMQAAQKFGCSECHEKDGKEQKYRKYAIPHHEECARCHGVAPKNVAPNMVDCVGCHKPYLAARPVVTELYEKFFHDSNHELDTRPGTKKIENAQGKKVYPFLDCAFCHKDTKKSKRLQDIAMPTESSCTVCHTGKDVRALTPDELSKLKPEKK